MKICKAPGCGNPVFGKGFCKKHQYLRDDDKDRFNPVKIVKQRFSKKFVYDNPSCFKSETDMYKHILRVRGSKSFISGIDIKDPKPINFAHVLPKGIGQYPHFRFNWNYCVLVTATEHYLIDSGTIKERLRYAEENPSADWQKFYDLKEKALEEYKQKYG